MAEENTTDSTQTTGQTAPPTDSSTSSTTDQTPAPADQPAAEDDAPPATILTGGDAGDADKDKPADDAKGGDDKPAENAALFGAPEGTYELTGLPEGTVIDEKAVEAVTPLAKELGLSNEGFSKLAGVYAEKILPQVADSLTEKLQGDIAAQHAAWADETVELIKTDPAFGGEPLPKVQQVAAKALDRFGGEDFRKFCTDTGLGNHPALVKFAYLAGSAISEDTTFERGGAVETPKSSVEKFYGKQT